MHVDPVKAQPTGRAGTEILGSLSQKIRGKQLTTVRWTLVFVAAVTALFGFGILATATVAARKHIDRELVKEIGGRDKVAPEQQQELIAAEEQAVRAVGLGGVIVLAGAGMFLLFAILVKAYPAPVTILSLVLFLAGNAVILSLSPDPWRLIGNAWWYQAGAIIVLARSIKTAVAFEQERLRAAACRKSLAEWSNVSGFHPDDAFAKDG